MWAVLRPGMGKSFRSLKPSIEKAMFAAQTITGRRAASNKPASADLCTFHYTRRPQLYDLRLVDIQIFMHHESPDRFL